MTEHFHENMMFWNEIQRTKKGPSENGEKVKTEDSAMLLEKKQLRKDGLSFLKDY